MNLSQIILLIACAYISVSAGVSFFSGLRAITGISIDLLPMIMTYIAMNYRVGVIALFSIIGGVMYDSLSANPLGITCFGLFSAGAVINYLKQFVVKTLYQSQSTFGFIACMVSPLISLVAMLSMGIKPLIDVEWLLKIIISAVICGLLTPLVFKFFQWIDHTFNYKPVVATSFRADREIEHGI